MSRSLALLAVTLVMSMTVANAATFRFDTDPFEGSNAPTTPGRQVVGGEPFITFDAATDLFSLDPNIFGITGPVVFANDEVANLPTGGANFLVLRTFDNDSDPLTPFGAGNAANLIANQVTTPGAGFFIYFNSGLDLPRLVFSTNLDDNTADLKIIARLTNLSGAAGRDALVNFNAENFQVQAVPEPSTYALFLSAGLFCAGYARLRRRS